MIRLELWRDRAACRDMDPAVFFPEDGAGVLAAQRVCAGCEVRRECLDYALERVEQNGVFGGTSERERMRMRRKRRAS
jgi:WhiB family transcriptional regulator, redox-sensing transcriptional regulator